MEFFYCFAGAIVNRVSFFLGRGGAGMGPEWNKYHCIVSAGIVRKRKENRILNYVYVDNRILLSQLKSFLFYQMLMRTENKRWHD